LRGEPSSHDPFPQHRPVDPRFLPADYLPSEELRISSTRNWSAPKPRIALDAVSRNSKDRFGPLPQEARGPMDVSRLRMTARDIGIAGL